MSAGKPQDGRCNSVGRTTASANESSFKEASLLRTATAAYLDDYPSEDLAEAQSLLNLAKRIRTSLPTEGKQANLVWSATGEIIRGVKKDDPERVIEFLGRAEQMLEEALTQ